MNSQTIIHTYQGLFSQYEVVSGTDCVLNAKLALLNRLQEVKIVIKGEIASIVHDNLPSYSTQFETYLNKRHF